MKAAELRQAILQAAVQGKLVPQNVHDEPAGGLLKALAKKREALLSTGYPNIEEARTQLNKQKKQVIADELDELPEGWEWATLMQCSCLLVDCHNKTAPYVKEGIPLIRTSNVRDGKLVTDGLKYVDEKTFTRWSARCIPEPGDIIITREAPMGEICILPIGMRICLGQRLMLIRLVPDTILPRYIYFFLRNPNLMQYVQDKPVGLTVQHLRVGGVETMFVPVPPLAEQKRIVAKLDELMTLCDELEAAENDLDTLETQFAEYLPKSILQAAVQGKLVPQNVHDEPASKLLERIQQEKARLVKEGKIKKEKPLPPITEDEIPFDLPDGWVWCRLGDITNYGVCNNAEPSEIDDSEWLLELEDIEKETGTIVQVLLKKQRNAQSTKHAFAKDDVLYGKLRPYLNKVLVAPRDGYCSSEILPLKIFGNNPAYVAAYLRNPCFVEYANQCSYGVKMPRLGTDDGRNALFALPPLAEQQRIVAQVDYLMSMCNELKAAHDTVIKPTTSNIIQFPKKADAVPEDEIGIAARGDATQKMSAKLHNVATDLLKDDGDE